MKTEKYKVIVDRHCQYCIKALNALVNNNKSFEVLELRRFALVDIQKHYNHFSVPLVFKNGIFIGGFSELEISLQ